jgi:uncharacterized protein (UPF0332 family)
MSFDWLEYLNVAKELASVTTTPASQEAKLRAAISRAYYAAFIKARNHLRDKEGYSIPRTGNSHRFVSQQFVSSSDAVRQSIADKLSRLKAYRKQADYVDKFPGISGVTMIALTLSEEIITTLNTL